METLQALIPFALALLAFYWLIIRPARVRQRAAADLLSQLAPGTEVMTGSGIFGRVLAVEEDKVRLEVAPGTAISVAKPAIARIVTEQTPTDEVANGENPA